MTATAMTIDQILAAFTPPGQPYQRAAVEAALQQGEAIIPALIQILEQTLADPASQERSLAPIYAVLLLGHLRATAAHELISQILRLPKAADWAYRLFDDLVTEAMPMILFRTCGGAVATIQRLIEDRQADDFCRGAGVRALTYAVVTGIIPRTAALEFFGTLFSGAEAEPDSVFWTLVFEAMSQLYPAGWVETLRSAAARDLIDESVIGIEEIEEIIETGSVAVGLQKVRQEMARYDLADIHASLAEWVDNDIYDLAAWARPAFDPDKRQRDAAAQAKKKQKRKAAKAARKQNRRKK